jgi:hypothetical protein
LDYPHILVRREQLQAARRAGHGGPRERPHHDSRASFASDLQSAADEVLAAATSRMVVSSAINPHLVFRIPVADAAASEEVSAFLEKHTTAVVVGVEADGAIVAFKDEVDLDDFNGLVSGYRAGPKQGVNPQTGEPYKTTTFDVLDYIVPSAMSLWSRHDRIGVRLRESMTPASTVVDDSTMFLLDVELWHPGSAAVRRSFEELLEAIIASGGSSTSILDRYVGSDLVLARVRVPGTVVNTLLDLDAVAEIDSPPRLNNLHVYGLPNPAAFCRAHGARRISVAVAHDPPVRRRRSDYLGVELDFCVIRGLTLDEVFDAYSGADPSAKLSELVPQRCRVTLSPGSTLRNGVARHRSTLQLATKESGGPDRNDWGSDTWLVIRSQNRWLPSDADAQKYAVAVSIESTDPALYNEVRARIAQRATVRARARARV